MGEVRRRRAAAATSAAGRSSIRESPIVAVASMMPGLSAEEMEIYFSKSAEERMADVAGLVRGATSGTLRTQ